MSCFGHAEDLIPVASREVKVSSPYSQVRERPLRWLGCKGMLVGRAGFCMEGSLASILYLVALLKSFFHVV